MNESWTCLNVAVCMAGLLSCCLAGCAVEDGESLPLTEANGRLVPQDTMMTRTPESKSGVIFGVVRSEPDVAANSLTEKTPVDWSKYDAVFIYKFIPLHSGVYREFRITEVLKHDERVVVKTSILENQYMLEGGSSLGFHCVLIPATDLPVEFEINVKKLSATSPGFDGHWGTLGTGVVGKLGDQK